MTTYLIYADSNDGHLVSQSTTYSTARTTGAALAVDNSGTYVKVGQNVSGTTKVVYEAFWSFDTSVIADTEEIVDATINMYSGWTRDTEEVSTNPIYFFPKNWTAPLTTAQWTNPDTLNTNQVVVNMDYLSKSLPYKWRSTGHDALIGAISKTAATKFISISANTLAGIAPNGSQEIWQYSGNTTNKPYMTVYTTALSTMNMVTLASTALPNGATVSIRSTGTSTPTFTVGYTLMTPTGVWTLIGTLDPKFANNIDGANSLTITSDQNNNFYIMGVLSGAGGSLVGQAYKNTSANTWTPQTVLSQALPSGNGMSVRSITASYMQGQVSDPTDYPCIYGISARGTHTDISGNADYYGGSTWNQNWSVSTDNLLAGKGSLFNGTTNKFMILNGGAPASVDSIAMGPNRLAFYTQRGMVNGVAVGGVATLTVRARGGYAGSTDKTYTATGFSKLVSISNDVFAQVFDNGSKLNIRFYNFSCQILGEASIPAANFNGGIIGNQFTAFYDKVANLVRVHYVSAASPNTLDRIDVSPVTFSAATTFAEVSGLGSAGTTNPFIRSARALNVDERRVSISAGNVGASATLTTPSVVSIAGNVAPNTPTLQPHANFDATSATSFSWLAADSNPNDYQSAVELEISKVSDGSIVISGKQASISANNTIATGTIGANFLSNSTNYRWRIRTWDMLDTAGTWSGYGTFTTAATGTLNITDPISNNASGINTSFYDVKWTYTQSGGQIQAQRRVVVTRVSDSTVMLDTGMQASTDLHYMITGLASDTTYRVDVSLINSASIAVPTVSVTLTPSYSTPMTPQVLLVQGDSYVEVQITNPTPDGSRPEVATNAIYSRVSGGGSSDYTLLTTVSNSAIYRDYAVVSGVSYDYYITGTTSDGSAQNSSLTYSMTAPSLVGVWMHSPSDAGNTISNYPYGIGRTESIGVQNNALQYIGRTYPVYDLGVFEDQSVSATVTVPYSPDYASQVDWFRSMVRNRKTICYRDSRGRKYYVIIVSVAFADTEIGTDVSFTATTIDYRGF